MDTIIIPFFPAYARNEARETDINKLTDAAWRFAQNALWTEQLLPTREVTLTKNYIQEYLIEATDKKRAFTALCQRVLLAQRYIANGAGRFVPPPSVWFNRYYRFGFAGTLDWLYGVEQQRRLIPGYLAHIEAQADDYYHYATKPRSECMGKSRRNRMRRHASSLIKLVYITIINGKNIRA
jgi:hypothetical protein